MENSIVQFISHLYKDSTSGSWIIQSNEQHQAGVAEMSASFACKFGLSSWGRLLGLLHDKGKERDSFQHYIRRANGMPCGGGKSDIDHHHAYVGGLIAKEIMGKGVEDLLVNQIISHHSGLHDFVDVENMLRTKTLPNEIAYEKPDAAELCKELVKCTFFNAKADYRHFHHLSRMLFSCLVDADRLDTERFMDKHSWDLRKSYSGIPDLLPRLEKYIKDLQSSSNDTPVNRIRREIQESCRKASAWGKGFFSLTVPTGGGKTLSSLLWAMRHAVNHGMDRIIIAIPYTSIISQTAGLLKSILGENNVLEHHSGFNPDDMTDPEAAEKVRFATENWDYPIIVTTNVQLFESMFSHRPGACRKLHNIVNSVIILDEVQTLPTDFLQPIVDAMLAYTKLFGVSFLFTTASQPVLSGLIEGVNPTANFRGINKIREIIPSDLLLHDRLRRVELKIDRTGRTYDEIASILCGYDRVLCIVNTRKDAKELFDRLPQEGRKLHLSRMMCPDHVDEAIREIKTLLKDDSHSILRVVTTQLVEAGVDIDFPVVFRQEAGLDSILQAAGRCNREGKSNLGYTHVFSLSAEGRLPFGAIADAHNSLSNLSPNSDWFAPSVMNKYFIYLYAHKNTFDRQNIKEYLYKRTEMSFKSASEKFHLIDEDGVKVIVNWKKSLDLVARLRKEGCSRHLMARLARFSVDIRRSDFRRLSEYGAVEEVIDGVYVVADGSQYDAATGLSLDNHWMEEILMI